MKIFTKKTAGIIFLLLVLVSAIGIFNVKHRAHKQAALQNAESWVNAETKSQVLAFYFKGVLGPLHTDPVLSPVEGTVKSVYFTYGEFVRRGQPLVSLEPTKLVENFRTALASFLQKKAMLEAQQIKFAGDQELYQAGVIAKQDFTSSKNSYGTSVLDFNQAKVELDKVLAPLQIAGREVEVLRLSDTDSVVKLLRQHFKAITVKAPSDGVVLIPIKSTSDGSNASGETHEALKPGVLVKEQEPMLSMGDLTGYEVEVAVSELDITQIKPGLAAVVTGDAFAGIALPAVVKSVAVQADPNQSQNTANVSLFKVVVQVPKVSPEQQAKLRVGMTAKVEIQLTTQPQVVVPIRAVFIREGKSFVTLLDPVTKVKREVEVETGATNAEEIAILRGVHANEQVLMPPMEGV